MFNPNQIIRTNPTQPINSSKPLLERVGSVPKSRWDQPLVVPEILYRKFKINSPNTSNQSQKYPSQLLDFIRRCYAKCKDMTQSKQMQLQIKQIISSKQSNLKSIEWNKMAIPHIFQSKKLHTQYQKQTKKQQIILNRQQKSKTRQKNTMVSQQNQKINIHASKIFQNIVKRDEKKQQNQIKLSKGFSNQPEYPHNQSYINSNIRSILNNLPPPPKLNIPPPPPPKNNAPTQSKSSNNNNENKKKQSLKNEIRVIQSITPQPVIFKKNNKYQKMQIQKPKKQNKVIITRKQLNQISKVAQNPKQLLGLAKRYESFNKLKGQTIKNIEEQIQYQQDDQVIIVGKSNNIHKPYLRITHRPDPQTVRPQPILKKALAHHLNEYKQGKMNYDILISQLKSIRQDLTVQHIRNSFTVEVYQQNFKISLFQNDIISLRHCQANLWQLYREGKYHTKQSRNKYISYHFTMLILEEKYKELEYMLTKLPDQSIQTFEIQQTLKLKQIFMLGNYRYFFQFYNSRDSTSRQLLNIYIDKIRMKFLVMFCKTCGDKTTFNILGNITGQDEDVIQTLALSEGAIVRVFRNYPRVISW